MMADIYAKTINDIIKILKDNDQEATIRIMLDDYHDYELARALIDMDDTDRDKLYHSLSISKLTEVFEQLDPEDAFKFFEKMSVTTIINIFEFIETDDLVDIIEAIDQKEKQMMYLSMIPTDKRKVIRSYLHFDEDMVGSIMNNNYVQINQNLNVKKAIKAVVEAAPNVEYIHNIYVIDDYHHLVGTLSLKELINKGNQKSTLIKDIMIDNLIFLYPTSEIEDAIELMKNYDFQLLPVISSDHILIGIISFDDTLEAISDESSQDYASLAGLTDVEIDDDESVVSSLKKRLPWLIFLLFVNLITSSIIASYEDELQALTTLAIFMPLILSMAGNSSTQGLGVVIRLFATNRLDKAKPIFKHLLKEFFTGLINGLFIGMGLFVMVLLFNYVSGTPFSESLTFALVIALSVQVALTVATLVGSLIPLIINLFKLDPAAASGPFITTINDILSLIIYFGLATALISTIS